MSIKIRYWNRSHQRFEEERIYGEGLLKWVYQTWLGKNIALQILRKPWISWLCGLYQSSRWSARKIPQFIEKFQIPMDQFEKASQYSSFNDFFIRSFRPGKRPFISDVQCLPAFCEARYFGWKAVSDADPRKFLVKGIAMNLSQLLGGKSEWSPKFQGGPLLLARLCPVDYHRFHFPDEGEVLESDSIRGRYDSVNPIAFEHESKLLFENERRVTLLKTKNFGLLAYVEVGALCVGKIVQTYFKPQFQRGEEKGYFLFGGSTVIVVGEPGRWIPEPDLLEKTGEGYEVWVPLGESVARQL